MFVLFCFVDEKSEVQGDKITCRRSQVAKTQAVWLTVPITSSQDLWAPQEDPRRAQGSNQNEVALRYCKEEQCQGEVDV